MTQDVGFINGESLLAHRVRLNANANDAEVRLNTLETHPAAFTNVIYVDISYTGGSSDGSHNRPFTNLTTALAGAAALNPTEADKVKISIAPGTYLGGLTVPPHTILEGESLFSCIITGTMDIQGNGDAGQQTVAFYNLQITGKNVGDDIVTVTGTAGDLRIQFKNCSFSTITLGTGSVLKVTRAGAFGTRITSTHVNYTSVSATGDDVISIDDGNSFFFLSGSINHADSSKNAVNSAIDISLESVSTVGRIITTGTSTILSIAKSFLLSGIEAISYSGPTAVSYTSITTSNDPAMDGTTASAVLGINVVDFILNSNIDTLSTIIGNRLLAPNILYDVDEATNWPEGVPLLIRTAVDTLAARSAMSARSQSGMIAFRNTNDAAGTWSDITAALLDGGAGAEDMFDTGVTNNTFYVGADTVLPVAIGYELSTAITLGGGTFKWQYYNGAWTDLKIMETKATTLLSNANVSLGDTGKFHLRHDEPTDSAALALNGETKHWIRAIITSDITTSPVVDNANWFGDGIFNGEFFGTHQRPTIINIYELQDVVGRLSGNSAVLAGVNTGIVKQNNTMSNNAFDSFGVVVRVPEDINTALDLTTLFSYFANSNNANDWECLTNLAKVKAGDVADGTLTEQNKSSIIALSSDLNVVKFCPEVFDVEDLAVQDELQISVGRDATGGNLNDAFTGAIIARVFSIAYKRWK